MEDPRPIIDPKKVCKACGESKYYTEFYKEKRNLDGLYHHCKSCFSKASRESHLIRTFGITIEDYDRMLKYQGYRCAICGSLEPKGRGRFHVDHNHETGENRGLLCSTCNQGLGLFREDPKTLINAAEYLNRFGRNRKVIFTDLDGTLVFHQGCLEDILSSSHLTLLPGVREKMDEWVRLHYYIIITTGRPEESRELTIRQLDEADIPFHKLVMGIGQGVRIVINDAKPDSDAPTAIGVTVPRNKGLGELDI